MSAICGGWSAETGLSEEEFAMIQSLQDQVVAHLGSAITHFTPIASKKQVVAGMNYWVKIQTGDAAYIHVKIFKPLPHTGQPAQVQEVHAGKTLEDQL